MDLIEADPHNPNRHPWELARATSVLSLVRALPQKTQYADIGAGDLYFSRRLAERTSHPVIAVDTGFVTPITTREINSHASISDVPREAIDCAFLMDVLEHVKEDRALLEDVLRVVRPGGLVVLTVPAHRALWSDHDVFLGHWRRYSRPQLLRLAESCGLMVEESFYFFGMALASRIIVRGLSQCGLNGRPGVGGWRYAPAHPLTRIVSLLLKTDFVINRALGRASLPTLGLSICAVCRRPSGTTGRRGASSNGKQRAGGFGANGGER